MHNKFKLNLKDEKIQEIEQEINKNKQKSK